MSDKLFHFIIMQPGTMRLEMASARLPVGNETRTYYDALRRVVEPITGDPFEHVNVFDDFDGQLPFQYLDMFVNECGRLNGLLRNERATAVYRCNVLAHEINPPPPEGLPWIAGPAVLFSEKVWF